MGSQKTTEDVSVEKPAKKKARPNLLKAISPPTPPRPAAKRQPPAKKNTRYIIPKELMTGRPTLYCKEIADAICSLKVTMPITKISKMEGMPNFSTIYDWLKLHPEFAQAYARACEAYAEYKAAEIDEIADEDQDDFFVEQDGKIVMNHVAVQRHKLRIDARKWTAAKLMPKKYGDRIIHAGDDEAPIAMKMVTDSEELLRKLRGTDDTE